MADEADHGGRPRGSTNGHGTGAEAGVSNLPGRASRQDLTHRQRQIQRFLMRALPRLKRVEAGGREWVRRLRGAPHVVDFFHQVDDPYSQLALAAIPRLAARHAVTFRFHLVSPADRLHAPEPELLAAYARRDCAWIAPHYGLEFPVDPARPEVADVRRAERWLAGRLGNADFASNALALGRTLWWRDDEAHAQRERIGEDLRSGRCASETEALRVVAEGNALRTRRRHYSGGMFWYAGEWFWGVDRLHHLENRLRAVGTTRAADVQDATLPATATSDGGTPGASESGPCFPRPPLDPGSIRDNGRLSLEIFPSLRSPYTAVIFEKSLALARAAAIPVVFRPVMPMVMRGVPAPADKGVYIMLDAKREADMLGVPFGDMYDPIGEAVLRGFSLWPFARECGREAEYIAAFLRAAFVEGRPTGTDAGLRKVVEAAGLSWNDALPFLDSPAFRDELEANRKVLYAELGLWGVPSYRLRGPLGEPDLCVWGQDRLWLVAAEIKRRLA